MRACVCVCVCVRVCVCGEIGCVQIQLNKTTANQTMSPRAAWPERNRIIFIVRWVLFSECFWIDWSDLISSSLCLHLFLSPSDCPLACVCVCVSLRAQMLGVTQEQWQFHKLRFTYLQSETHHQSFKWDELSSTGRMSNSFVMNSLIDKWLIVPRNDIDGASAAFVEAFSTPVE